MPSKKVAKPRRAPNSASSKAVVLARTRISPLRIQDRVGVGHLMEVREKLRLMAESRPNCRLVRKWLRAHTVSMDLASDAENNDGVITFREAEHDIPPMPLSGYMEVEYKARITKLATQGGTGGGFYASLLSSDLAPWIGTSSSLFRVKKITSWTASRSDAAGSNNTQYHSSDILGQTGADGTEILPSWVENWTSIGQGFAGVAAEFPLGSLPVMSASGTATTIGNFFTALGGAGGVSGIPVILDVVFACLV
jgi:hypothetical protein